MTSLDRLESALARIAEGDGEIGAVTDLDVAGARAAAEASDARGRTGSMLGPLDGVIVGVKDNLAVRGREWSAGLMGRREVRAATDATAVRRLRESGAVVLASLNMHEGALGATTENPIFGATRNPLDPRLTPGGSSGGSAAAVAAGFVELALGTDTLGSVRIPAAYCGVVGLKPTPGRIGRGGLLRLSASLDCVGPIARRVTNLAPALAVLSGLDTADPDSAPLPSRGDARSGGVLRLGVAPQALEGCEAAIVDGLGIARAAAEAAGAEVVEIDMAGWQPARARRGALLLVEAEAAVALAELIDLPGALSDGLRAFLRYGRDLRSDRLAEGLARMRAARAAAARALAEVDMLLMPTAPQRAFAWEAEVPDSQADLTALANIAGLPALSLPVPLPGERLPGAVQLVGPAHSDERLLEFGAALEARLA